MQIYFAASIAGGRKYLATYQKMVDYLIRWGHSVPTEHIVAPNVWSLESNLSAEQIYERDVAWLEQADALIAEVSHPSLGVGYEICYALTIRKPVLCLYQSDVLLSRMILGNTRPRLRVISYEQDREWQEAVSVFLNGK